MYIYNRVITRREPSKPDLYTQIYTPLACICIFDTYNKNPVTRARTSEKSANKANAAAERASGGGANNYCHWNLWETWGLPLPLSLSLVSSSSHGRNYKKLLLLRSRCCFALARSLALACTRSLSPPAGGREHRAGHKSGGRARELELYIRKRIYRASYTVASTALARGKTSGKIIRNVCACSLSLSRERAPSPRYIYTFLSRSLSPELFSIPGAQQFFPFFPFLSSVAVPPDKLLANLATRGQHYVYVCMCGYM